MACGRQASGRGEERNNIIGVTDGPRSAGGRRRTGITRIRRGHATGRDGQHWTQYKFEAVITSIVLYHGIGFISFRSGFTKTGRWDGNGPIGRVSVRLPIARDYSRSIILVKCPIGDFRRILGAEDGMATICFASGVSLVK